MLNEMNQIELTVVDGFWPSPATIRSIHNILHNITPNKWRLVENRPSCGFIYSLVSMGIILFYFDFITGTNEFHRGKTDSLFCRVYLKDGEMNLTDWMERLQSILDHLTKLDIHQELHVIPIQRYMNRLEGILKFKIDLIPKWTVFILSERPPSISRQ